MLRRLWMYRELIREMAARQLREMYIGSALGWVWALMQPFCMLVVYTLVFGMIMRVRLGVEDEGPWYFALKLCAALLPWQIFIETLNRGTTSLVDNANLLRKSVFPAETLVVSLSFGRVFNFFLSMLLYLLLYAILVYAGKVPNAFSAWILFVPVVMLLQVVFTIGLCWITSCLHVYFHDTAPLVGTLSTIWFFGSPIVYNPHYLPGWNDVPSWLKYLYILNPWYCFVEAYQRVMMGYAPDPVVVLTLVGWAALLLVCGMVVQQRCRYDLMDVI